MRQLDKSHLPDGVGWTVVILPGIQRRLILIRWLPRPRNPLLLAWLSLLTSLLLTASCARPQQTYASYVPVAQLESSYGRLITVANVPTPDQNGTGDRLGLFQDESGTLWGIPLAVSDDGSVIGCAPPMLRETAVSDTLPADEVEIVGAVNEPTGWRGGTGKLELLLRDTQGGLRWHSVAAAEIKTGPLCLSQSEPVQPLKYYRLVKVSGGK